MVGEGAVVAGWLQGPPPRVSFGAGRSISSASPFVGPAMATRQRVVVDWGSLAGGVRAPLVLASAPSGSEGAPWVAGAGSEAFVAWDERRAQDVQLALLHGGRVVLKRALGLRDAELVALEGLSGNRAEIVWDQYGHGFPLLKAALITPSGRIGKPVLIAHPGGRDTAAIEISINARGDLVAAYVHDEAFFAGHPGTPNRHGSARVMLSVCEPALHCTGPRGLRLGATKPVCIHPAVAMTTNGTAIMLAAAQDADAIGCGDPAAVWQASAAPGHRFATARKIAASGDSPIATPAGRAQAIAALNPGVAPYQTVAWTTIRAAARNPVALRRVPDGDVINPPLLAANGGGRFVLVWEHASSHRNPRISLKAAIGAGTKLKHLHRLADGNHPPQSVATAMNAHGDAIVLWNDFTSSGGQSMHAAIYRR
jgi:hypothetical protein